MKRVLVFVLAVVLLMMCGCSKSPDIETLPPTQPTTTPTEAPTQAPTEPIKEVEKINPLTGEPLEELITDRAFCVMFNNSTAAMPQHGVSQADILYETLIEGETRCMGVFYNMASATEPLGSIRSARRDFIRIAMAYNAIYVHKGWSPKPLDYSAQAYFEATGWDHIDGNIGGIARQYFYDTRFNYATEHRTFIKPESVIAYAEKNNCTMTQDASLDVGLQFDQEAFFVGEKAEKVVAWFNMVKNFDRKWNKSTTMNYNADTGLYEGYQHGQDYVDGNTGKVLSFRNVLILRAPTKKLSNTLMQIEVVGSGTGYFACNGQIIPIKWSRASESEPYTYTLENGSPITLGVGKTYIAIIPEAGLVEYK